MFYSGVPEYHDNERRPISPIEPVADTGVIDNRLLVFSRDSIRIQIR